MKKLYSVMAALAVAGALAAHAEDGKQQKPPRGEGRPPMADKDGDGKVSVAEFAAMGAERVKMRFERLDADKDGKVTEAEFNAAREHKPEGKPEGKDGGGNRPQHTMPTFAELDANKDGVVTLEESTAHATAKMTERAKELDKNSDGFISKDEMPMRGGPGGPGGGEGGHQGGHQGGGQPKN